MKTQSLYHIIYVALLSLGATRAHALSLDEAAERANQNSHELKQVRLANESAQWSEKKALSGFMPRLDFTGRHLLSEQFEVLEIEFGGAQFAMPAIQPYTLLSLTASIDLFNGFETSNQLSAARLNRDSSEHTLRHTENRVRIQIRTLFYRALGSQILVDVADQNIRTLEGHLKDVNSRVRSGVSTRFDALRTEVQLEDAKTEMVAAQNNMAIARARLFEAIGIQDDLQPLNGKLPENFVQYDLNKLTVQSTSREDRVAQSLDVEAHEKLARGAMAHWMPRVSVFGSHDWYNNTNHSMWESDEKFKTSYALGVQLKWNLYDGGASTASEHQADIARQVATEKLAQLDRSLPVDLEEAKRHLTFNIMNYKAKLSSIRKAEEAVRLAQGGVRAGTRTNTEVLDAVVDLNRAKAASVKSQIDAIESLGQLELAVGRPI